MARFLIGATILIITAIVGISLFRPAKRSAMDVQHDREHEALAACRQYILDDLKAPSTAKWSKELAFEAARSRYDVYVDVEAQNPYGVPLASKLVCDVREKADDTFVVKTLNSLR